MPMYFIYDIIKINFMRVGGGGLGARVGLGWLGLGVGGGVGWRWGRDLRGGGWGMGVLLL